MDMPMKNDSDIPKMNIFYEEHKSELFENFITLFVQRKHLDLIFICRENIMIHTHKLMFACVSDFLSDLINLSGQDVVIISLPDVDRKTLIILINFLYEGVTKVNHYELVLFKELVSLLGIRLHNTEVTEAPVSDDACASDGEDSVILQNNDAAASRISSSPAYSDTEDEEYEKRMDTDSDEPSSLKTPVKIKEEKIDPGYEKATVVVNERSLPHLRRRRTISAPFTTDPKGFRRKSREKMRRGSIKKEKDDEFSSEPRRRVIFTEDQRKILEESFLKQHHPPMEVRKQFSREFGVPVESIHYWFDNRRRKLTSGPPDRSLVSEVSKKSANKPTRHRFTDRERQILETAFFGPKKYSRCKVYSKLSHELNVSRKTIMIWFHNRKRLMEKAAAAKLEKQAAEEPATIKVEKMESSTSAASSITKSNEGLVANKIVKHGESFAVNRVGKPHENFTANKTLKQSEVPVPNIAVVSPESLTPVKVEKRPESSTPNKTRRPSERTATPIRVNERQKLCMEYIYKAKKYPDNATYEQLSKETGLPVKFVRNWFGHRRAKDPTLAGIYPYGKSDRKQQKKCPAHGPGAKSNSLALCKCNEIIPATHIKQEPPSFETASQQYGQMMNEHCVDENDGSYLLPPSLLPLPDSSDDAYFKTLMEELKELDHNISVPPIQLVKQERLSSDENVDDGVIQVIDSDVQYAGYHPGNEAGMSSGLGVNMSQPMSYSYHSEPITMQSSMHMNMPMQHNETLHSSQMNHDNNTDFTGKDPSFVPQHSAPMDVQHDVMPLEGYEDNMVPQEQSLASVLMRTIPWM